MTRRQRSHCFCNLTWDVTPNHFCCDPILYEQVTRWSQSLDPASLKAAGVGAGGGCYKGGTSRRKGSFGTLLQTVYYYSTRHHKVYLQAPKENNVIVFTSFNLWSFPGPPYQVLVKHPSEILQHSKWRKVFWNVTELSKAHGIDNTICKIRVD